MVNRAVRFDKLQRHVNSSCSYQPGQLPIDSRGVGADQQNDILCVAVFFYGIQVLRYPLIWFVGILPRDNLF